MNTPKKHVESYHNWLSEEFLPKLPRNRRWKISTEPGDFNREKSFYLVIAIQRRFLLFWWIQDDHFDSRVHGYTDLEARLVYSVNSTPDMDEILRHAEYLKNLKYPDVVEIPSTFRKLTGTF